MWKLYARPRVSQRRAKSVYASRGRPHCDSLRLNHCSFDAKQEGCVSCARLWVLLHGKPISATVLDSGGALRRGHWRAWAILFCACAASECQPENKGNRGLVALSQVGAGVAPAVSLPTVWFFGEEV